MAKPDVETVDLPWDDAPKGFVSNIGEEDITPEFFDVSELPEGTIIYYISPGKQAVSSKGGPKCGWCNQDTNDILFFCSKQCRAR